MSDTGPLTRLQHELETERGFPRNIEKAILTCLPLAIVKLGALTVEAMHSQLRRRRISIDCNVVNRPLRAGLVACGGFGLIFVDVHDSPDERRFSASHETAHFVVDYLQPRERAIECLGEQIRDVLDGRRPAIPEERIDGHLSRVSIGPHVHIMGRNPDSMHRRCESRADFVAYNLLAPSALVRRRVRLSRPVDSREAAAKVLVGQFRLPKPAAIDYAAILYPTRPLTPLRSLFGFDNVELERSSGEVAGRNER